MRQPPSMHRRARRLAAWLVLAGAAWALAPARGAPFQDDMAQRTLACTACHGEQARAGPDGYYPRLAGKPAAYLYHQLLNFRDGRRHYGPMTSMVDVLNDDYLAEIARHFAALRVPYPPPAAPANPPAPEVLARGRALALQGDASRRLPACVQCHGERLTGALPHVPGLLGLPSDYLTAQLGGWRTGQRRAHAPDCMARVVQRLSDQDAYAVVSWLAAQPVPAHAEPTPEHPAPGNKDASWHCGRVLMPRAQP